MKFLNRSIRLARAAISSVITVIAFTSCLLGRGQSAPWPNGGNLSCTETVDANDPNRVTYSNWTWTDPNGVAHVFSGQTEANPHYIFHIDQDPTLTGFTYTTLNTISNDGIYNLSATGAQGNVIVTGSATTNYLVLGVIYSPPGGRSTITFNKSNAIGFTHNTTNTWKNSINVKAVVDAGVLIANTSISITAGWTDTLLNSVTTALTTTSASGSSWNGTFDGINHDNDVIIVWLNPQINTTASNLQDSSLSTVSQKCVSDQRFGQYQINHGEPVDINIMDLAFVTVAELRNPSIMDPNGNGLKFKKVWANSNEALTQNDFNEILKSDPFWNPNAIPTIASLGQRYKYVTTISYQPNNTNTGYDMNQYSTSNTNSTTHEQTFGVAWSANAGIKGFFQAGTSVSEQFTWTQQYSDTATNTGIVQTSFSIIGPTSTPSNPWLGPESLNVYRDTLCGSYLFSYALQ